jgi:hypothetical protein
MLSCVGDNILHEFNTLYLTRFRNYKIAFAFGIAFYQTNLSTERQYNEECRQEKVLKQSL